MPYARLFAVFLAVASSAVWAEAARAEGEGTTAPLSYRAHAASYGRCYDRRAFRARRTPFNVELEVGPTWQTRNDVALPGDTGTRFGLDDVIGNGPFPWQRVIFDWQVSRRHGLRLTLAPFEANGTGALSQPVTFDGQNFAAGVPTRAAYKFNSYRLTYRYTLLCNRRWTLRIGATAKIRDARVQLVQGNTVGRDTDLGFVPLLYLGAEYKFAPRWRLTADLDGAAAEQGRAFDLAVKLNYDISPCFYVAFGYRGLEGGADNDTVYTFAWLHQAVFSAGYRF